MDGTDCGKHDDKLKHRVLTLPSLRGGLLVHALKKIKKRTGVLTCELRYLDYGAEVVINGKPGSVLNCEEAVLQVAEGSIDGLGFAEVRHEVSFPAAKKLDTGKAKLHRSPAQAIGCMTGCDLILDEAQSQMLVVGPSEAVARGAARLADKFLASRSHDLSAVVKIDTSGADSKCVSADVDSRRGGKDSEERAWKPPAKAPPQFLLAPRSDRPISPVVQAVTDEFGRRYYWNHMDATSSWHPPPPHIGFWEHLLDYRTGRAYFVNRGTGQTSWDLLGRLHPGAEAKAKLSAPSPSAWVPPSTPPAPPSTVPTEAPSSARVASVSVAKSTDGQIEGRREARLRTRQALEEIKARRRRSPGPPGPSSSVPDYEAAEDFLELPAGGGAENQAEDRNDDDVEADAEPGELVYNEEEEDVFITEGAEGTQTHPETFVEEGDPGRSSQTDQQDMSDEVLVDLDPIPDDGQAFWEQDMSMEFDLANKDDTFEGDVFEQEDLDDFADEEAIKHELLSEIQTLRERQEEGVHPEGDIVWQVDEEELHDMEHEQVRPAEGHGPGEPGEPEAEPGDGRTKAKVIRPPMQPKSKHKAKPTPPSEPPPNWHNGAESSQADLHDDAGTQWTPWRSQKAGGKRQQAKGTWTEQKTKRKVEYAGNSPPALRRKSWSTDNWAGHEGRGSEWGDSSWDGPSHQRGYRHAKPMDKDWSRDWKAWKDESTWQRGSSSSSNRGWSWKRR